MITLDIFGSEPNKKPNKGVTESAAFGSNYAEQLAREVYKHNPNLDTSGRADRLLNLAYNIAKNDLGRRAQAIFNDEDFPSDFVSAYSYLKKWQGVAEDQSGKFQLPGVGSWLNVGQQQQATDDTPGNFSIVVAGRQGKDFQAITLAKALETILPRDYPRSGWPKPGCENTPTHHVIQEVLKHGQAVVKDGIGSKDVADSIAVKFK